MVWLRMSSDSPHAPTDGQMGIGHVRYPTAGSSSPALAQPFYVNSPYGLSLAHNGNLTNTADLNRELYKTDLRHMNTDSDSEVLLNIFAHELSQKKQIEPRPEDIFSAVEGVHKRCRGGYAAVVMITGYGYWGSAISMVSGRWFSAPGPATGRKNI